MAQSLTNTFIQGTRFLPLPPPQKNVGRLVPCGIRCRTNDIYPQLHGEAKAYCNGELGMTTGGTQKEYVVVVWSGNHPSYLGNRSAVLVRDDQVEKFRKKFGELTQIMEIPVLKGETVIPSRRNGVSKGGKKK